jgi:hypothetical protein
VLLENLQPSSTTLLLIAATAAPLPPEQLLMVTLFSTTCGVGELRLPAAAAAAAVVMGAGALAAAVLFTVMAVPVQPLMVKSCSITADDLQYAQDTRMFP